MLHKIGTRQNRNEKREYRAPESQFPLRLEQSPSSSAASHRKVKTMLTGSRLRSLIHAQSSLTILPTPCTAGPPHVSHLHKT